MPKIDARGSAKAIAINLRHSMPALAALEDLKLPSTDEGRSGQYEIQFASSQQVLKSGQAFVHLVPQVVPAIAITLKTGREISSATDSSWVSLKGMRIKTQDTEYREPTLLARASVAVDLDDQVDETLPLAERKKRLLDYFSRGDWTSPKLKNKAEELIAAVDQPSSSAERLLTSSSGNPILVASQGLNNLTSAQAPSTAKTPTPPPAGWVPASLETERQRPLLLEGAVEISGGLAFTGTDSLLTIARYSDGRIMESGQVWVRDGRFEIAAKALKGFLVAELRDSDGQIVGRGELDLYDIPTPAAAETKVRGLKVLVKPETTGMELKVVSADSFDRYEIAVPDVQLFSDGIEADFDRLDDKTFSPAQIIAGSSLLIHAKAKNFWGSSAIGVWNATPTIQMFSENKIRALLNIVLSEDEKQVADQFAIVWGRVTEGGLPVAGAQVELAGDGGARPIYFNELFIPDRKLEATSGNGYFVFVLVTPGIQSVRAKIARGLLPAQVISADRQLVSFVELDFGTYRTADVKVFDPRAPDQIIPATLSILGTDAELDVNGRDSIQFVSGAGQMVVEVDAGDAYELSRSFISRQTRSIEVPIINRDWLGGIIARRNINLDVGSGTFVGYVADDDFEVSFDEGARISPENIIYFSRDGQISHQKWGQAGGGFVVFNIPEGYRTMVIVPRGSGRMFTHAFVAEDRFVQTLSLKLQK